EKTAITGDNITAPEEAGSYDIFATVTDKNGYTSDAKKIGWFTVGADTTPPEVNLLGEGTIYVEVYTTATDPGATAVDDISGTCQVISNFTSVVDFTKLNSYVVTYKATDTAGNEGTATRIVVVRDTIIPTISLRGDERVQIKLGETYQEAGVTISDNFSSNLEAVITGSVKTYIVGSYILKYTATDSSGNTASVERIVVVVDDVAPVITFLNEMKSGTVNVAVALAEVQVVDNSGERLNYNVIVSDSKGQIVEVSDNQFTPTAEGTYTITVKATDSSGNEGVASYTVTVKEASTSGCGSSVNNFGTLIATLTGLSTVFIILKKRQKNN
ncbi:MAG: immunoglobulin-like domain-containing protein, partial [Candidatus Scatosoma sp.]